MKEVTNVYYKKRMYNRLLIGDLYGYNTEDWKSKRQLSDEYVDDSV